MNKVGMDSTKKGKIKTILLAVIPAIIVGIGLTMFCQQALAQTASDYDYRLTIQTYNGQYMEPNRDTLITVENKDTGFRNAARYSNGYPPGAVMYWFDYQMPIGSTFEICFGYDDALRPINCEAYIRGNTNAEVVNL